MNIKAFLIVIGLILLGIIIGASGYLAYFRWLTPEPESYIAVAQSLTPTQGKPFLLGFTTLGHETNINKLKVRGKIPAWINGTFVSIGPGKFEINESKASHWLDGFAMIHRFTFNSGSVSYANRLIKTNYYEQALKKGKITGTAPDQTQSTWSKLKGALSSANTRPIYDNVNINVFSLGSQLMALTETPQPVCIDCQTLETKHAQQFNDKMAAHFSAGHPLLDPNTNEWINVGIQYAMNSSYVIYKINDRTKERTTIASIKVDKPSYVHSFAMTKKYIILTEMPLRVSPYDLLMGKASFIDTHQWNGKADTIFTVIDRLTGKVVDTFKTHSFFALHHVNAFETKDGITVDIVTYKDPSVLKSLGFDHIYHAKEHYFPQGTLERFELQFPTHKVMTKILSPKNIEMPQINYRKYTMSPYTFVYGVSLTSTQQMADQIIKINVKTGTPLTWMEKNCYPTEAIFIPSPQGKTEDDGVLLCVVLDAKAKTSFLLILDAKTMKELGRAEVPHHIPFTVHSSFLTK